METEFIPGKIAECIDDPDIWGVIKSVSDCGECVYLQMFGKINQNAHPTGYVGIRRDLLKAM